MRLYKGCLSFTCFINTSSQSFLRIPDQSFSEKKSACHVRKELYRDINISFSDAFCLAVPLPFHHGAHLILPPPEVDPHSFVPMSHHSLSFCLNYWKLLSLSARPPLVCPMRDLVWFTQCPKYLCVCVCVYLTLCVYDPVCTAKVDVAWFYRNCLTDTCNCDRGGDCECLCTSIAAYAHKCCQQGVTIHWRSPSVCRELPHNTLPQSQRMSKRTLNSALDTTFRPGVTDAVPR